ITDSTVSAMLHGKALHSFQVFLLTLAASSLSNCRSYPRFSRNDTEFQHLVLHPDPLVERVYIGAKDHLFQLDGSNGLQLEQEETTGPVSDSKDCLPPVTQLNCPQARRTSNHNKLLLVDPKAQELITCGSVHQGTCQKRSLASIREVLFSTERPVDTQYVAANDPSVSTVGLVVALEGGGRTVMYVGRGYTASHPPISTRHLSSEPVFSYEDTAKLAVAGRLSEYDHHFVTAFTRRSYVYFLFYRRDIKSVSREYRTYAARACLEDSSYYSYVEIPLVCRSSSFPSRNYNLLQAAQVGQSGSLQGEDLLGVFSTRSSSTNGGLESSALCVFPLEELDRHIDSTRDLCYTQDGQVEGRGEVAYIEYEVKSSCANLPPNTLKAYPCGSDHTPSPMASRAPLEATASWHTSAARLTAVAVSVAEGHSIAFLGDSKGNLHKVYLGEDGVVEVYEHTTVHPNSPISSDLLLDLNGSHIYIMTKTAVSSFTVMQSHRHERSEVIYVMLRVSHRCFRFIQSLNPDVSIHQTECELSIIVSRSLVYQILEFVCSVGKESCNHVYMVPSLYCRFAFFFFRQQFVFCLLIGCRPLTVNHLCCVSYAECVQFDPVLSSIYPQRGPKAGGSYLTIRGRRLRTGHPSEVSVLIGGVPCLVRGSNRTGMHNITVRFGGAERHLQGIMYRYTPNPNITDAKPSRSFLRGGRIIRVSGQNLDVVQEPKMRVTLSPPDALPPRRRKRSDSRRTLGGREERSPLKRWRRIVPEAGCPDGALCHVKQYESRCTVNSSSLILCPTPAVGPEAQGARVKVHFLLDSLHFDFSTVGNGAFSYEPDPKLHPLNQNDKSKPYHHKPGSIISVEGEFLDLAMFKHEVEARIGDGLCVVKTLTHNHLYCEPPAHQPSRKQDGMDSLPEFTVKMGNLNFSLGRVQYDTQPQSTFPLEAQVGVGVGASIVALIVLIIVLIYRRKSKQAMRDYKKVQIQLENLETSVRDRCKKEFTDLMTEMMDMSSDLVGSGIPFLDYRAYAERIFFPGHQESPLRRDLDVPESRRQTVEQGLVQLSNLLNSKLFLIKFIHTLEAQRTFSPRDRAYVASLLTVALHGKLEYFTDILKTLLNDLVEQYVAKNPKLMLRRTESVVEKLLTNWMSICLYTFLRESAGESFYMLFRAIKHQVDKGPVDAVTGKAKYTLNDNRLLREDVEYRTLTLNVVMSAADASGGSTAQTVPAKVLDCDTITQVKEKVLEQTWKGTSFSQRPHIDSLNLEWRAGVAGHLILSDEDLTSVLQGSWKRLNTLQHYKVPDGATVALVSRNNKHLLHDSHDYMPGEKTPMLDDGDEGGVRLWHLVKAGEEPEMQKHRRGSMRERGGERAKAIPEIYLTRLLSMKVKTRTASWILPPVNM
uniref:Plexin b1a n=1 Tax=Oryzias sinensis TaxID=183150 RepID=A0A8C7YD78_9TELE